MKPQRTPPACTIGGSASETAKPLSGIAVCRMPRASPRCCGSNQCMTARPLADWTLAPASPANASSAPSARERPCALTGRDQRRAAAAEPDDEHEPLAEAVGRKAPRDQAETSDPTSELEMRNPVCASDRSSRSRRNGAITATPNQIAEYVACANVPAARMTQR